MILHVSNIGTFIPSFVKLINKRFSKEKHKFWLLGENKLDLYPIEKNKNIFIVKSRILGQLYAYLYLLVKFHNSKKIILHGLFNARVVLILALCPWLLKKCFWIIWGADLYQYQEHNTGWKAKLNERFRKFVIKRIGHLVSYIPGDIERAREWYGATGQYHKCLMYLSNVVDTEILEREKRDKVSNSKCHILVGNSADPTNNHLKVLEKLLPFKEKSIEIYLPLSYGDKTYADKVIQQGTCWFEEKLFPMTSLMSFEQYIDFLDGIDIAVFNHKRQQAMGNTITLLGLGKTVYIRSDTSQWQLFEHLGVKVKNVEDFDLSVLSEVNIESNKKIIEREFNIEKLVSQYSKIFEQ